MDPTGIRRRDFLRSLGAVRPTELTAAAQQMFAQSVSWLVIGDLSKIESAIRSLNLGEVEVILADARSLPK